MTELNLNTGAFGECWIERGICEHSSSFDRKYRVFCLKCWSTVVNDIIYKGDL